MRLMNTLCTDLNLQILLLQPYLYSKSCLYFAEYPDLRDKNTEFLVVFKSNVYMGCTENTFDVCMKFKFKKVFCV